jgi:hypothetical protein
MYNNEINRNMYSINTNVNPNINQFGVNTTYTNFNYPQYSPVANQAVNPNNVNPITNNNQSNKKSYPADIDMLFDSHFMKESNLTQMENNLQDDYKNKDNHFDFVNDMLKKPNKFR